jgi:hypothetical protein
MGGANVALPFSCKNMGIYPILYDILYADFCQKKAKSASFLKIILKSIAKSNKRIYLCSTKLNKHTLNKRNYGSND